GDGFLALGGLPGLFGRHLLGLLCGLRCIARLLAQLLDVAAARVVVTHHDRVVVDVHRASRLATVGHVVAIGTAGRAAVSAALGLRFLAARAFAALRRVGAGLGPVAIGGGRHDQW